MVKNKLKSLLPYAVLPLMLGLFLLLMANTTAMPTREVHGQNGVWICGVLTLRITTPCS